MSPFQKDQELFISQLFYPNNKDFEAVTDVKSQQLRVLKRKTIYVMAQAE